MSSNISFNFERLRGRENYDIWFQQAKSYFVIKDYWSVVERKLPDVPSVAPTASNEKARAELTLMIEPYNYGHIASAESAHDAWKELEKAFQSKGLTRKVELLKTLD